MNIGVTYFLNMRKIKLEKLNMKAAWIRVMYQKALPKKKFPHTILIKIPWNPGLVLFQKKFKSWTGRNLPVECKYMKVLTW